MTQTVGEAMVRLLADYGVDTVFGIPGVHTIELYRGLAQSPIRHVLPRHEQGAAFMADGYARASGRPGVCFLISGPGIMNAMTPIGQAYSDSVPMLVVSAVLARADIGMGRGQLHEMKDQQAAVQAIAGWSATAHTAPALPRLIARAFGDFAAGRPRPVHIQVPIDLFPEPAEGDWRPAPLPAPPQPDDAAIERASAMLLSAKAPVMIVGGGASRAASEAAALASLLRMPVVTTIAGKGVVPATHPFFAASMIADPAVRTLVAGADVVLAVGTELATPDFWDSEIEIPGRLIRIDIDPHELTDRYGADIPVLGDAGAALSRLNAALASRLLQTESKGSAGAEVARLRETVRNNDSPARRLHRTVLDEIARSLPNDMVLATDMTQIAYSGNETYPLEAPRLWLHPVGFGALGYALPAAIGASFARPGRPVAAIAGDYGFQFTANELATACEAGLSLPVFIWNNSALGEIRDGMAAAGFNPLAVEQKNPDFGLLAKAYGCRHARPASLKELESVTLTALEAGCPTLIEITREIENSC